MLQHSTYTLSLTTPSSYLFSCSSHSPLPPRYLHSFPTRRSSDLIFHRHARHHQHAHVPIREHEPHGVERRHARSEEHTSELQSHHDLVCRLLLEKKNKKSTYQTP